MRGSGEPEDTDPYRPRRREEGYPSLVVRLEPESFFPSEYVLARSSRRDKTRGNYIIASWGNSGAMTPAQRESECHPEPAPGTDQSRDLVFRRSPGHGSQSKHDRWDPALNGRHEEPGVASGGDREMGNHSTNTGIFTWSMDSGQEEEEMQSH